MCVFVRADLPYIAIDIFQFCVEKVIQLCVLQISIRKVHFIVLCLYRSTVGNSKQFFQSIRCYSWTYMYKPQSEFLLHWYFNVNYWSNNTLKHKISVLLQSYNLAHAFDFHSRIC